MVANCLLHLLGEGNLFTAYNNPYIDKFKTQGKVKVNEGNNYFTAHNSNYLIMYIIHFFT